jgi:hypothetical protein
MYTTFYNNTVSHYETEQNRTSQAFSFATPRLVAAMLEILACDSPFASPSLLNHLTHSFHRRPIMASVVFAQLG